MEKFSHEVEVNSQPLRMTAPLSSTMELIGSKVSITKAIFNGARGFLIKSEPLGKEEFHTLLDDALTDQLHRLGLWDHTILLIPDGPAA